MATIISFMMDINFIVGIFCIRYYIVAIVQEACAKLCVCKLKHEYSEIYLRRIFIMHNTMPDLSPALTLTMLRNELSLIRKSDFEV